MGCFCLQSSLPLRNAEVYCPISSQHPVRWVREVLDYNPGRLLADPTNTFISFIALSLWLSINPISSHLSIPSVLFSLMNNFHPSLPFTLLYPAFLFLTTNFFFSYSI